MGKNTAFKRNAGRYANSPKDYFQIKQSYKVRLGMFGIFLLLENHCSPYASTDLEILALHC